MKKISFLFVFFLVLGISTAQADTITYDSILGGKVTTTYSGTDDTGLVGEFQMTADPAVINAFGYCVDYSTSIWEGSTYDYTLLELTTDAYKQAAWLIDKWAAGVDEAAEGIALQLAIWEVLYVDDFSFTATGTSADTLYKTYIGSLSDYDYADIDGKGYKIADLTYGSTKYDVQNIIVQQLPVPEPATMLLFGIGLLGLTAAGRKKS